MASERETGRERERMSKNSGHGWEVIAAAESPARGGEDIVESQGVLKV